MHQPMRGVRVLEVAQMTFVPAAGAVLADWGAEVIKVEHAETGDAQRGLTHVLGLPTAEDGSSFFPIMEGPNRGKRSIGLALDRPEARQVLADLVRRADVFLTNFLPDARAKLGIELDDIRAINPDVIYVRGSGFGTQGPEARKGGYDATAFWARGGSAHGVTPPDSDRLMGMPSGAYGDNIGGITIAGGIAAALFARERTGETSVVDVSLLGVGAWATQYSINQALLVGGPLPPRNQQKHGSPTNPLIGTYRTADGKWLMLSMLQPGKYWPEFCRAAGRAELAADDRFLDAERIAANAVAGAELVAEIVAGRPLAEWTQILTGGGGQWSVVQDAWDAGNDASLRANGQIATVTDAEGTPRELVVNPVRFDETAPRLERGPLFAEHTDEILRELGRSDEQLIELKIAGAVT